MALMFRVFFYGFDTWMVSIRFRMLFLMKSSLSNCWVSKSTGFPILSAIVSKFVLMMVAISEGSDMISYNFQVIGYDT